MRENLSGKYWNVMSSIRFTGNMEILLGIFWELLEEQGQESIDILSCSDGIADGRAAIGVTDIDGLVKEDD